MDAVAAAERPALLAVGTHAAVDHWLAASGLPPRPPEAVDDDASAAVWVTRAGERVVAVVSLREPGALDALLRPLPHYGRQSWLRFDGRRAVARGTWPADPPLVPVTP